jgi:hypothetical protein
MPRNNLDLKDNDKFYYQVMRKTIVQFLDMFNEIVIGRYDNDTGQLLKYISVPLKFAPKTKEWYWSEKTDPETGMRIRDRMLPMMACNLLNVQPAQERTVNSKYRARTHVQKNNNIERFFHPVPYDYTFEVKIAAEYMVDITQIMEMVLPYFDNYLYIRLTIPELDIIPGDIGDGAYPLDLKVQYDGNSKEETLTFDEGDYRTIIWTMSFRVEGYLFKPKWDYPIIKKTFAEYKSKYAGPSFVTTSNIGLSAEKYPLPVASSDMDDAMYDEDIKLLYKYERTGD